MNHLITFMIISGRHSQIAEASGRTAAILTDDPANSSKIRNFAIAKQSLSKVSCPLSNIAYTATFYHLMQKLIAPLVSLLLIAFLAPAIQAKPDRIVLGYSATWRDPNSPPGML